MATLRETLDKAMTEAEAGEEGAAAEGAGAPEEAPEPAEAPEGNAAPAGDQAPKEPKPKDQEPATSAERPRRRDGTFRRGQPKAKEPKPAAAADKGKAGADAVPALEPGAAAPPGGAQAPAGAPVPAEQQAAGEPALKPPASWKPLAQEQWAKLPKDVQKEVLRVDGEVRRTMQVAAQDRQLRPVVDAVQQVLQPHMAWLSEGGQKQPLQTVGALLQAIQPFEGMIRAEGSDPVRAVGSVLRTVHALRYGTPQVKAKLIASLVQNDLGGNVELLVDALEGKLGALDAAPARGPGAGQTPAVVDPNAIAQQVRQQIQQDLERRETARILQEERTAADRFLAGKEFADVVRPLMADLVEIRGRQGVALTVEDAYQEALWLHPDTKPVMQQRQEAKAAQEKEKAREKARAAASSVKTQPAGTTPPNGKPAGLRATIDRIWDEQAGRE